MKFLKDNRDIILVLVFTIGINFFPNTEYNPTGTGQYWYIDDPLHTYAKTILPSIMVICLIYNRWRKK